MRPFLRLYPRTIIVIAAGFVGILLSVGLLVAQTFRVTSIKATNNDVQINWDAPGGSNYVVQTATSLTATNFADVSSPIYVPGASVLSTGYTHLGGMLNSTSRFYRVKSVPAPPTLQIYPSNAIISINSTNRYQIKLVYPDNSIQDVTASATVTSLGNVAQSVGADTNGFTLVRGTNQGNGFVRAVYQGISNTVPLSVAQLTGIYTVPPLSQINSYVKGQATSIQVMGVFSNGKTNNITPSSNLDGGAASVTRADYHVQADVANSFALITGQSAANGSIAFTAGDQTTVDIGVTWCKWTSVTLAPASAQIGINDTLQYSVIGNVADGSSVNVGAFDIYNFYSSDDTIAQADSTRQVACLSTGMVTITVQVNNGAGCSDLFDSTTLTVTNRDFAPTITNQPADQIVAAGSVAYFSLIVGGTPPFAFQWQSNSVDIPGATSNSLLIQNASIAQQAAYRVVITNASGAVTSSVANLTVVPAATRIWTRLYNGPANDYDSAQAIALDPGGNVFVTGGSYYAAGSYSDYVTIRYSSAGVPLWTNRYNGPGNGYDFAGAIAVDSSSNVFVTGSSSASAFFPYNYDYATIKYSSAGARLWTNRYNGPANEDDGPNAIALDTSGNAFATGYSTGSGVHWDYTTIKYSNAGARLWTNRYNGPGNGDDEGRAIAVDSSGNLFVTGYSYSTNFGYDYATFKYSNTGARLWTNRYSGPSNIEQAQAIALDAAGNVFVTGSGEIFYETIKYSNAGAPLWTNYYQPGGNAYAKAIAVDGNGNVFVTGYADYSSYGSGYDYATIKYSNAGVPIWTNRFNGPGYNHANLATAIAVDSSGNAIVTGYSASYSGDYDIVTLKYSSAGAILWLDRYNGPGSGYDDGRAVAVDSSGNVFVTGSSAGIAGDSDYVTIKYSP
jgi:uncharacterized delta-60 repeat protein